MKGRHTTFSTDEAFLVMETLTGMGTTFIPITEVFQGNFGLREGQSLH
jgi:hypothetical protein